MENYNYIKQQLFDWLKVKKYKSMNFNTYMVFVNNNRLKLDDFYEAMDKLVEEEYFIKNYNLGDKPVYILTEKCEHIIMI